jgi:hypothetical protein
MNMKLGKEIDNTCAVHIEYEQDDRGNFRIATLGEDDWGDRAVVVSTKPCDEHFHCEILTVAPDESDTLEDVHAKHNTEYTTT